MQKWLNPCLWFVDRGCQEGWNHLLQLFADGLYDLRQIFWLLDPRVCVSVH